MDETGGDSLHPDVARAARRRSNDDPEAHEVYRARSTSRNQEMMDVGDMRSMVLQQRRKDEQKIQDGK
jgi:hypothetical protein